MFGIDDLILGGLSFGGSLLSGLGAKQSAAKQQRLAIQLQAAADAHNQAIGQRMIATYAPENIPKDAAKAGFNPVTYLNAMGGSYGNAWSQGWSMLGQGVPPTVNVPSTLSAIGGAISAGTSTLMNSYQSNQRLTAAKQASMLSFLGQVQMSRARGNSLAGLGTPFFEITGQHLTLPTGGAAAALSLGAAAVPGSKAAKAAAANAYGYEPAEKLDAIPSNYYLPHDPSIPKFDNPTGTWHDWWTNARLGAKHMYYELQGGTAQDPGMIFWQRELGAAGPSSKPAPRESAMEANINRLPRIPEMLEGMPTFSDWWRNETRSDLATPGWLYQ